MAQLPAKQDQYVKYAEKDSLGRNIAEEVDEVRGLIPEPVKASKLYLHHVKVDFSYNAGSTYDGKVIYDIITNFSEELNASDAYSIGQLVANDIYIVSKRVMFLSRITGTNVVGSTATGNLYKENSVLSILESTGTNNFASISLSANYPGGSPVVIIKAPWLISNGKLSRQSATLTGTFTSIADTVEELY